MRRLTRLIAASAAVAAIGSAPAWASSAASLPLYEGSSAFPEIVDASGPETYAWEVSLARGQALRQVDERSAEVYYVESGQVAFAIEATKAHDAAGADVPTTLEASQPNVVTLVVHHLSGNPLDEGAPFAYPVAPWTPWVVIGQGQIGSAPLLESAEVVERAIEWESPAAQLPRMSPPPLRCRVPSLFGRSLRASRRALRNAHCAVGRVATRKTRTARPGRVVKQTPRPGTTMAHGAGVSVVVARSG